MGEREDHRPEPPARHEYSIEDTVEAGIVLRGTEIKSVRAGQVSLADAFAGLIATRPRSSATSRPGGRAASASITSQAQAAPAPGAEIDQLLGRTKARGLTISGSCTTGPRQGQAGAGPRARQAAL